MIGYYNYTVILTYIGMLSGFAGITLIQGGDLKAALICLIVAGLCDMFDGRIASTMERTREEKRFGIQIDSLSDLICFGVLPALIFFQCSGGGLIHRIISSVYVLCALIRLAWINVNEEQRQEFEDKSREAYLGLPVTTAALLIPFLLGSAQLLKLSPVRLCIWVPLLLSAAFVSPFRLRKPNTTGKIIIMLCGAAALALVLTAMNT